MKTKWIGVLLLTCGSVSAQTVFTNGVNVNGRAVQGVGLIDITNTNLLWGSMAPSLAQLAGLDTATGVNLGSAFLVPLRPAWLETDGIYAHTTNGLTFYDENGSVVLSIRAGAVWSAGGTLSNLTPPVNAFTGGRLAASMLPAGGTWDAGGMTLSNVAVSGNGAGLRGISVQNIAGLGSAAQRNATSFASAGQGDLADTALQEDSYAPDLGASITTNYVSDTNTIIVTGTGFPATLTYRGDGSGQYYLRGGTRALLINIAWTNKPQSVMGDYWENIDGTWYLAYTCSGSPTSPTGTLTALDAIYMKGSGTDADAAYSWDNTSSTWKNMAGYWITNNTAMPDYELWGPSGDSNVLLATSSALDGAWTVQSCTTQLNYSAGFWGNITMSVDNSGNAHAVANTANAIKITSDGTLHYLARWNTSAPQADIIGGQIDSGTLVGHLNLYNGFLVQGTENDGFYAWNGTDAFVLNDYYITVDAYNQCTLFDPDGKKLYDALYGVANTTGPWNTDHGTGECHSGIWSGQPYGTTAYGDLGPSISAPARFYIDQTSGVAQFSSVTLQTNKLSFISGLATTALQPGANLTNLTGQLAVTALPTGSDKTWDAGGLTLNNVTFSGSTIVGLSADQITAGLLSSSVMPSGGTWDAGGMTVINAVLSGDGNGLTNLQGAALSGTITVDTVNANTGNITNLTVVGQATLLNVPARGDLVMGSYTNGP
jgi:hypothetical protein